MTGWRPRSRNASLCLPNALRDIDTLGHRCLAARLLSSMCLRDYLPISRTVMDTSTLARETLGTNYLTWLVTCAIMSTVE
jgi:hypothetical protein